MKKILFTCLLAGSGELLAQNLDIADLQFILHTASLDSINSYIGPKGYSKCSNTLLPGRKKFPEMTVAIQGLSLFQGNAWYFYTDNTHPKSITSILYKWTDSAGTAVRFETSNTYFYAHLMNQLEEKGFRYSGTTADNKEAVLTFCNDEDMLEAAAASDSKLRPLQITFQPGKTVHAATRRRSSMKRAAFHSSF